MNDSYGLRKSSRFSVLVFTSTLVLLLAASLGDRVRAEHVTPPPIPPELEITDFDVVPFLEGHAVGTQNYICLPTATGFAWTFFGPQATLFADNGKQVTTHFLSPNPEQAGTPRATWQDSHDTSRVWADVIGRSSDAAFVATGAIQWLLLARVGSEEGTQGSAVLADTTHIQRLNTSGGIAPATGCSSAEDVGKRAFVPYTADYIFYKAAPGNTRRK